jgi:hypothetical protein
MRNRVLVAALFLLAPTEASAEWQVRPFIGFTFAGSTTFVNPEHGVEGQNPIYGVSAGWLGEIFGFEGTSDARRDFSVRRCARAAGGQQQRPHGDGECRLALPRRIAEYSLRPYFSGGAGLMRVNSISRFEILPTHRTLPAIDLGGALLVFTDNVGVSWDSAVQHDARRRRDRWQQLREGTLTFWRRPWRSH